MPFSECVTVPEFNHPATTRALKLISRFLLLFFFHKMLAQNFFAIFKRQSSTLSTEIGKKWAGKKAMQDLVHCKPSVIGLGSGSTIVYAIEQLAKTQFAKTVVCIPTSFQTRQLILAHNLKLGSLEQ